MANDEHFYWADEMVRLSHARHHLLIMAVTGAGKGLLQRSYLASIVPHILQRNSNKRCFCYDPKREMVPLLAGMGVPLDHIRILHPLDARCVAVDLARDFATPALCRALCKLLVPERPNESQPFFPNATRALLWGILRVFLVVAPRKWTLRDLVVATWYRGRIRKLLERTGTAGRYMDYFENKTTFQNIKTTLDVTIADFEVIAALWHGRPTLSLTEWLETSSSFLVMGRDASLHAVLDPINRLMLDRLAQLILSGEEIETDGDPEAPYTFLNFDELPSAGKLEMLATLLREGRSKGACVLIALQMLYSLREVYGENVAHEIVSQCRNRALLSLADPDTAEFVARWIGEDEFEEKTVGTTHTGGQNGGISTNTGYSVVRLPRILPCQMWEGLPPVSETGAVHGYFYSPALNRQQTFQTDISLGFLKESGLLTPPAPGVPAFELRPESDQVLEDWTVEDLERLGLVNPMRAEESIRELLQPDHDEPPPEDSGGPLPSFPKRPSR